MIFDKTEGFHIGQKVAVVDSDGASVSPYPWFVRGSSYVHQFRENEFIWIYELVRLRSTKDDRIIPTGTLEDVYLNHEVGPTYIEIESAPGKRLIPWAETPKDVGREAPEGSR